MSEETRQRLQDCTEKAINVRFKFQAPDFGEGPVELHSALVAVQESLTQLEEYLSQAIRAKADLDRKEFKLKMIWQEAFDRALVKKSSGFGSDFVTGKEKSAEANLAAFNEARALRLVQEELSFANEAVDVIRLHYYGLDKVRQDIRKRLDESRTDFYS